MQHGLDPMLTKTISAAMLLPVLFGPFVVSTALAQPESAKMHTEAVATDTPESDVTSWAASLGGSLYTGNTRSRQLQGGSTLRLVRGPNVVGAMLAFAYGEADVGDDMNNAYRLSVKNFNSKLRYDYFFTEMDAVFVAVAFRWDEFAGLDHRIQVQLGYLRNIFKADNHRFWGEVGYDLSLDNFHPDPLTDPDDDTIVLDGTEVVHSGRLFLGYDNRLSDELTYLGGLEGLINVEDPDDVRINWDNALRSSIGGSFQLELKFTLKFDAVPVPGTRKTDTATLVNLIYNLI